MEKKKFEQSKQQILANVYLNQIDFSPKGSIDSPIRELVWIINQHSDYYTTSSCSGRVSISVPLAFDQNKGVQWLFVKHGYITEEEVLSVIAEVPSSVLSSQTSTDHQLPATTTHTATTIITEEREEQPSKPLATLKCEPFIMHICCQTLEKGQWLHQLALESGFRESGLTLGTKGRVMLAIRSTSFNLELPIAQGTSLLIKEQYLALIIREINHRMKGNFDRIHSFFTKLKSSWRWPSLQLQTTDQLSTTEKDSLGIMKHQWKRWGHSVSWLEKDRWIISGGQGIENKLNDEHLENNLKSSRNVSTITISTSDLSLKPDPTNKHENTLEVSDFQNHVHGQLSTYSTPFIFPGHPQAQNLNFILLSGGRLSPMQCLKCISFFQIVSLPRNSSGSFQSNKYVEWKEFIEIGDIPEPRWGHSFLQLSTNQYCLFSGRNHQKVFDDVYLLTIAIEESDRNSASGEKAITIQCYWNKLRINFTTLGLDRFSEPPLQRFFHAACVVSMDLEVENIITKTPEQAETTANNYSQRLENQIILIHGGLSSLSNPRPLDDAYIIDLTAETIKPVNLRLPASSSIIARFGHSLTILDGKCILMLGGMSSPGLKDEEVAKEPSDGTYFFDYTITYSSAPSNGRGIAWQKDMLISGRLAEFSYYENDRKLLKTHLLPCQRCRCHHQIISSIAFNPKDNSRSLYVIGGGAMTLAFGNHYCQAMKLIVLGKNFDQMNHSIHRDSLPLPEQEVEDERNTASKNLQAQAREGKSKGVVSKDENGGNKSFNLCLPVKDVKTLKTWLENYQYYDKQRKIVPIPTSSPSFTAELLELRSLSKSSHKFDDPGFTETISTVVNVDKEDRDSNQELPIQHHQQTKSMMMMMLIPITEKGYELLFLQMDHPLIRSLLQFYHYPALIGVIQDTTTSPSSSSSSSSSAIMSKGKAIVYGEKGANEYLHSLLVNQQSLVVQVQLLAEIPTKYEYVGDVILIPETALLSDEWITLSSNQIWKEILTFFPKATRIGRKAIIEKSLMRQSQIDLLYVASSFINSISSSSSSSSSSAKNGSLCSCGKSHYPSTALTSSSSSSSLDTIRCNEWGWVTLTENRIKFSFDLTRVMFCSGNITERMRMEKLTNIREKEVIFDLYCGIGYYTIPLLVYHGAKIQALYACEWNGHSISALKHNLIQNQIFLPSLDSLDVTRLTKSQKKIKKKNSLVDGEEKEVSIITSSPLLLPSSSQIIYDFSAQNESHYFTAKEEAELHEPLTSNPSQTPLSSRVKILYGNNAVSTASFEGIADRILLGLLPSSENGWEIAIRLLHRERGGILHLHENVLEKDLDSFLHERLLKKLSHYCEKYKKPMTITILHIEKVKSYSPHVYHYVFDLSFTPTTTIITK